MIVIIDYGMGNLGSILNMLKKIGTQAKVSSDPKEIMGAEKLILPGVGAFDTGMARLEELELIGLLNEKVLKQKTPTLGVCLGMQLLFKASQEGNKPGLSWVDGEVRRFSFEMDQNHLKVPHMGWNTINIQRESELVRDLLDDARFYFVHSYHAVCNNRNDVIAYTNYGYDFASIVQVDNVFGTQFHPEKSHKFGMKIYRNFVELY